MSERSLYEELGGQTIFLRLAAAFYEGVADDPVLRPLYPESLSEPAEHLGMFLAQFFGGPPYYSMSRGHPMLRARHMQFPIGKAERDAWVGHMLHALNVVEVPEPARGEMQEYFERAATFLINRPLLSEEPGIEAR
jgi:hemoglobin